MENQAVTMRRLRGLAQQVYRRRERAAERECLLVSALQEFTQENAPAWLARELGVSRQLMCNVLAGRRGLSDGVVRRLGKVDAAL